LPEKFLRVLRQDNASNENESADNEISPPDPKQLLQVAPSPVSPILEEVAKRRRDLSLRRGLARSSRETDDDLQAAFRWQLTGPTDDVCFCFGVYVPFMEREWVQALKQLLCIHP
jgi:hypothetical protein